MNTPNSKVRSHRAINVIFVLFIFCGLGLLFDIYHAPSATDQQKSIYIQLILGAEFFLAISLFFFNEKLKANLLLIIFSSTACLYVGEIFLKVAHIPENFILGTDLISAQPKSLKWDERSRRQVIQDYISKGVSAVPAFYPALLIENLEELPTSNFIWPLAGMANKFTVYCNENGQYTTFESDKFGFRNNPEVYNNPVDLLLIGDSYTQGSCVDDQETVAGQLSEKGFNTLNLGIARSGALHGLARLLEYGSHFRPSTVLWLYFEGNDLNETKYEMNIPSLTKYLFQPGYTQGLMNKQPEINRFIENFVSKEEQKQIKIEREALKSRNVKNETPQTYLSDIIKLRDLRNFIINQKKLRDEKAAPRLTITGETDNLKKILALAQQTVNQWNGQLIIVYLPEWYRFHVTQKEHWDQAQIEAHWHKNSVMQVFKELNIPVVDFQNVLDNKSNPMESFPFEKEGHYNAKGYKDLADAIALKLTPSKNSLSKNQMRL